MINTTWGSRWSGSLTGAGDIALTLGSGMVSAHGAVTLGIRIQGKSGDNYDVLLEAEVVGSTQNLYVASVHVGPQVVDYVTLTALPLASYDLHAYCESAPAASENIVVTAIPFAILGI